jgi:hypothetical protein
MSIKLTLASPELRTIAVFLTDSGELAIAALLAMKNIKAKLGKNDFGSEYDFVVCIFRF